MNILIMVLCSYVLVRHKTSAKFTALSDSPYVLKLYKRVRNSHPPADSDPAAFSAEFRREMCKDIFKSKWFLLSNAFLVDQQYVNLHPTNEEYARVYAQTYSARTLENAYRRRRLVFEGNPYFRDYSFLCPVNYENSNFGIVMFAVTKEYDVSAAGQPYKPGHFLTTRGRLAGHIAFRTILAEEPALLIYESSVNFEDYYKNMRNYMEPAPNNDLDPLCRLVSDNDYDIDNQHFRFCAAVLRSTDFKNLGYPEGVTDYCSLKEVSFRKNPGDVTRGATTEKRYYERMTRCPARNSSGGENYIYISRAYRSNQLFVYVRDTDDGKIYLVNLIINVSIVDELNSFDFFEL